MLIIFAYHNFCLKYNGLDTNLYVSISNLEKQLKFLLKKFSRNFEFLKDITDEKILDSNVYIAITVDDGCDNFNLGYKIFLKRNIPVTLFVSKNKIGKKIYEKDLKKSIKYLNKKDLLHFEKNIVDIQNHGYDHLVIKDNYENNFLKSKTFLEKIFEKDINIFCYPYGYYEEKMFNILRDKKYKYACTTDTGINYKNFKKFRLKRIPISSYDDGVEISNKIKFYEKDFINKSKKQ